MNSMRPRADFLLEESKQGELLSSSTLTQIHSTLSRPDSQLSTSLLHYCGPKGSWERHEEMHRLERYKSRQFGGSSALNHCLLFKRRSSWCRQRNPIKTSAFCYTELCGCPTILTQETQHITRRQAVWLTSDPEKMLRDSPATRIPFSCWLTRKCAELAVILLCPQLCSIICHPTLSLPLALCPSSPCLAGVQEWLSVEEPNCRCQIHYMPVALSQAPIDFPKDTSL